jgi:hypothetical protein
MSSDDDKVFAKLQADLGDDLQCPDSFAAVLKDLPSVGDVRGSPAVEENAKNAVACFWDSVALAVRDICARITMHAGVGALWFTIPTIFYCGVRFKIAYLATGGSDRHAFLFGHAVELCAPETNAQVFVGTVLTVLQAKGFTVNPTEKDDVWVLLVS